MTTGPRLRAVPPKGSPRELDEVTFARAQRGDRDAQAALVERYERPVFGLLSRLLGNDRPRVEDLAQETFLRVLRAIPGFDRSGEARLSTWILTIATRLALDDRRRQPQPPEETAAAGGAPSALPAPDHDVQRRALAVALVEAVEALGDPFKAAFLLREVHELSYEEIAEVLKIDSGTVKSRLARARAALREALSEVHDG
jgi:RNA polymerase sigma-70 factor (ECF subfamily)